MSKNDSLPRPPANPWSIGFGVAVFVTIGVLAYLIYQAQNENRDSERKRRNVESTSSDIRSFDSLQQLLEQGDADDLIRESKRIQIAIDSELAVKLENIEKQVKISDRLMSMKSNPEAYRFGLKNKISVMALWYTLDRANHLGDDSVRPELESLVKRAIADDDPAVRLDGHVAWALVLTHDFLNNQGGAEDSWERLYEHFDAALKLTASDAEKAHNLYTIALLVRRAEKIPESVELFQRVHATLKDASSPVLRKIAENAYDQYVFTEYDLAPLILKIQEGDRQAMADFRQRIERMVQDRQLTDKGFERLFSMLEAIMQTGRVDEALSAMKFVREQLATATTVENREQAEKTVSQMVRRAEMFGRVMDLNGLVDVDGHPIDVSLFQNHAVVILYWAPNNAYAVRRVGELFTYANAYQGKPVRFLVVYPEYQADQKADEDIRRFAEQATNLMFVKARADDPQGKAFLEQFPLPFVPYVLVLDANQQLRGINPSPQLITDVLSQTIEALEGVEETRNSHSAGAER